MGLSALHLEDRNLAVLLSLRMYARMLGASGNLKQLFPESSQWSEVIPSPQSVVQVLSAVLRALIHPADRQHYFQPGNHRLAPSHQSTSCSRNRRAAQEHQEL
ncbi:hypothetical protein QQF64_011873 [Cirrhinus molitorella]|uniref:Uncharacterized protein n=1 Tax=Cirrhinus molitorella TaxID=172907 RepID=A0ABR3LTU6_9TELE